MGRRRTKAGAQGLTSSRRWDATMAARVLEEWAESGECISGFARRRGMHPQRLAWWRDRLGLKASGASAAPDVVPEARLIPVTVRAARAESALVVELEEGLRIEVRDADAVAPTWVAGFVRSLREGGR